jgi:iron complex transport system ATP-binding protein
MSVLSLHDIHAAPWGSPLLHGIHFDLQPGEILGVAGPNGAGKSTLLEVVAGIAATTKGEVSLLSQPMARWSARERAQRLAVLPQLSLLSFPYTVEEVILIGRVPGNSSRQEDLTILRQVMAATDTTSLSGQLYTQLSGGEKQRVQLARVLAQIWHEHDMSDRVLLLDEPTTALDLTHQQQLLALLKELSDRGLAVIVTLHDFNLLAALAHRVLVIAGGRQIALGSTQSVLTRQLFEEVFSTQVIISTHPTRGHPMVISA